MENDFPTEEKLPTEGGIKKDTLPLKLWNSGGEEQKTELCTDTDLILNAESSPSMNYACADITILHGDNYNTLKDLKISSMLILRLRLHTDTANHKL